MNYHLFLDDQRTPISDPRVVNQNKIYQQLEWVVVKSFDEFTQHILKFGLPAIVSFDHDLGDTKIDEKTGHTAAKWLVQYCIDNSLQIPICYVHSANTVGAENIVSLVQSGIKFQGGEE